jgi:hypothetical protein
MATTTGDEETMAAPETGPNLVQRVVQWLRAGYPDGVPQQDYVALLGILKRSLTDSELAQVVAELTEDAQSGQHLLTRELLEQRIEDVVKGPIDDGDIIRVSSRLASAGWPLASPPAGGLPREAADDTRPGLVGRVVDWIRTGYPSGLPDQDYVPLVALLRRRLSDDELRSVSTLLRDNGVLSADRVDIGAAIVSVTSELPSQEDIGRVRRYLVDHGGPTDLQL